MALPPLLPPLAVGTASLITAAVLAFALRARRLNHGDLCGLCAVLLPLEERFRFNGRTVCAGCARRVRLLALPRPVRVVLLLTVWATGAAALTVMARHQADFRIWAALFGGLVLSALFVGALPAPANSSNRTAATLQQLHALRTAPDESTRGSS